MRKFMTMIIAAASTAALLFSVTACKELFTNIEEDFSYWASESVITGFRSASPAQTNPAGVLCVPSATDAVLTLTVRNPKNFTFVMPGTGAPADIVTFGSGIHDASGTNSPAVTADYTLVQSDRDTLTLTYKPAFLKRYEHSRANIGTSITLYSTDGRKFNQTYSFDLEANTPPPNPAPVEAAAGKIALFKTRTPEDGKHYYVLCFKADGLPGENMPAGVPLHSDLTHVYVCKNGGAETAYPVTLNSGDFVIADPLNTAFIAGTDAVPLSNTEAGIFLGSPQPDTVPSGPWVLYLKTDVPVSGVTAKYGIRLFDGKLYSARAEQTIGKSTLPAPKVFAHADMDNTAVSGVYTEKGATDASGNEDLNATNSAAHSGSDTDPIPVYSAYGNAVKLTVKKDDGNPYPAGVILSQGVQLVSGSGLNDSIDVKLDFIKLPSPADAGGESVYKVTVKATGEGFDDSTTRTLYYKVCREVKAVNNLPMWYMLQTAIKKIPLGGAGTVKISGTLKADNISYPPLPDGSAVVNNKAIDVSEEDDEHLYPGRTVTVIGDAKTSSILDASNLCSVFSIEFNGKLILKNVTLQNGEDSSRGYGGGIYIGDSGSSCEMTDTDITNCTVSGGAQKGGAVYVKMGSSLTVGSGCVISGNTAPSGEGAGIYVGSGGTFNVKGSAKVDQDNDVFLAGTAPNNAKITLIGSLSNNPVARITVPNENYAATTQVLAGDIATGTPQNYTKFTVTPKGSEAWSVGSDGKLQLKTVIIPNSETKKWKALIDAVKNIADGGTVIIPNMIKATGNPGDSGEIVINKNITIKSLLSHYAPPLDADKRSRIFKVESGKTLTLENITLMNGEASQGGGIYNEGTLIMKGNTAVSPSTGDDADKPGKNDVYLKKGKTITLDDGFSPQGNDPVARITLEEYRENAQVLTGSTVSTHYNRFTVTPENGTDIPWYIDNSGRLATDEVEVKNENELEAAIDGATPGRPRLIKVTSSFASTKSFTIANKKIITIKAAPGITLTCNKATTDHHKHFHVTSGKLTFSGNITLQGADYGHTQYALYVEGGTAEIKDNVTITGFSMNTNAHTFAGVYTNGILIMSGGTIKNGKAKHGGGVYIEGLGVFTMTGGTITGNTANHNGRALWIRGTFNWEGGTITGNHGSGDVLHIDGSGRINNPNGYSAS